MATQVIVVEDDNDSREILSEYLEMKEIKVVAKAENGKEAVEMYTKFHPEVVLLDIVMPGYDGFYALARIRELDQNAKVIFVTAATNATTQERLFKSDVDAIVFKPYEMDELMKTISIVKNGGKSIPKSVRSITPS